MFKNKPPTETLEFIIALNSAFKSENVIPAAVWRLSVVCK